MHSTAENISSKLRPSERPAQRQLFPRNQWYVIAGRPEVGEALLARKILGQSIVLYRTADGQAVALSDWCPHRSFRLSQSTRVGDTIRCSYHGMRFDASGKCVEIPSQKAVPSQMGVRSFPVVEDKAYVWIWPGDPARADPALLPDLRALGIDEMEGAFVDHFPFSANAQLLIDNLADSTHATYLHPGFLDNPEDAEFMQTPMQVEIEGNVIRSVQNFGEFRPRAANAAGLGIEDGRAVNRTRTAYEFPPSLHASDDLYVEIHDPEAIVFRRVILGATTPADERSCYLFSALFSTSGAANETFQRIGRLAIDQDRPALEYAQMAYEECGDALKEMNVRADQASIMTRRIIAAMVANEQGEAA